MKILGITGNIATGKSLASSILAEWGAHVIDADTIVHTLYRRGNRVFDAVTAHFGKSVAGREGIDRAVLATIVFSDRKAMQTLERIVHPAVGRAIGNQLSALPPKTPAVIEAIRLVEGSSAHLIDELWIITAPHNEQLDRLVRRRGYSRATAEQRLGTQTNPIDKEREFRALRPNIPVYYLENTGTVEELRTSIKRSWKAFLKSF
jgi:dephospho-CoA kinase